MLNFKDFKKYYKNEGKNTLLLYCSYVFKNSIFWLKSHTVDAVIATYMCIRFPFLYPRNRWTGRHYNNWDILDKRKDIYCKWSDWSKEHFKDYYDKFGASAFFISDENERTYSDFNDFIEKNKLTFVKGDYVMKFASMKDRFLYNFYGVYHFMLEILHAIPTYNEFDEIKQTTPGWYKRFGMQFLKELRTAIIKSGGYKYLFTFRISQLKEKYGQFECYTFGSTEEVDRVINKYHYISQFICSECGEDAVKKTLGYVLPYCEKCLPKYKRWVWIDPVYGWSDMKHKKHNEQVYEELDKIREGL